MKKKSLTIACIAVLLGVLGLQMVKPNTQPIPEPKSPQTAVKQPHTAKTEVKKPEPKPQPKQEPPVQPKTDCDILVEEIQKYDWNHSLMLAIAKAESGCRKNATGDTNITFNQNGRVYGYSVGMFQVRILPGREHCDTHEIAVNVQCAYQIFRGQGLRAWSVYTSERYLKFL